MQFPPEVRPVIDELLPLCRALGEGACAVSIGGSYGKGTYDRTRTSISASSASAG